MKLLLRAAAGSRLYGTHNEDSDYDVYEIYDTLESKRRKAKQKQVGKDDVIKTDLSRWMMLCHTSHQALDCMFAPAEFCDIDLIGDFRRSYFANTGTVIPAFRRAIKNFEGSDSLKKRRHAVRLRLHVEDLIRYGRYNPHLDENRLRIVMSVQ